MSAPPPTAFNILILGGGIAGLACSVGLRRHGHSVTVIERSPELQTFGGSLLISANALRVLEYYGLLDNFKEVAAKFYKHTIYTHDGKVLDILTNEANEKVFGFEMLNVKRSTYQRVLYDAAVREGVMVRFGCRVESVDESTPSVTLSTGETITADLLIGADGIKSIVRPVVLGTEDVTLVPNSTCYQCTIPASRMNSNPLTAALLAEEAIDSWWGPNRHFICGRRAGGKEYDASFFIHPDPKSPEVVSTKPRLSPWRSPKTNMKASQVERAASEIDINDISSPNGRNADRRGDVNEIRSNVSAFEPRVQAFVNMVAPENCSLWKVAAVPDLPRWVGQSGKVVLLGDAAHAMVPHLGQGAAVSIEDGGILTLCLNRATSLSDIPLALRAYESLQKPRAEKIKRAALQSGVFKTLSEGPEMKKRDEGFAKRMEKGPMYEFWRASGHLEWIYAWDFRKETKKVLDKTFGVEKEVVGRARI